MNVGAGFALEAERVFEVEGDDGVARVLEHEVAQRADGDLFGDLLAHGFGIGSGSAGLARVDFGARGGDELVDQVVGLDAEALASADFDVGFFLVLIGDAIAEFFRAAGRERDHLVAEVGVVIGLGGVAHAAQRLDDVGLRVGLARVNHVIDGRGPAEVRMGLLAVDG